MSVSFLEHFVYFLPAVALAVLLMLPCHAAADGKITDATTL